MDTLGTLIDKQSILMIRRACAKDEGAKQILDKMIKRGENEINTFYYQVVSGLVTEKDMIVAPKLKNYAHQDNSVPKETKMGVAIHDLIDANIKLWDLEDQRRDPGIPGAEKLSICDDVSIWNKERNDAIDNIDRILWDSLSIKDKPTAIEEPASCCMVGQHCHGDCDH